MADHLADTHTDRSVYAKPVPAPKLALCACDRLPPKCLIDCPQREPGIAASSDAPRRRGAMLAESRYFPKPSSTA